MKRTITLFLMLLFVFTVSVYAADEYTFGLEYQGAIVVNEEKDAAVTLTGVNGPTYTNVLIKVDIQGPETPKLLAYDSAGNEYDIAQIGSWGPPSGFAVQGDFTNRTPIRATFTKAGEYKITVSLVDLNNSNAVITSREFTLQVSDVEDTTTNNTITDNNTITNTENTVTEIPKTGLSFGEMIMPIMAIMAIILVGTIVAKKKYNN